VPALASAFISLPKANCVDDVAAMPDYIEKKSERAQLTRGVFTTYRYHWELLKRAKVTGVEVSAQALAAFFG
jgi:hypothetical protein